MLYVNILKSRKDLMKNKNKRKRLIFVGVAFLISILLTIFIVRNFYDEIVFFYSPSEIQKAFNDGKIGAKKIRVGGLVVEKSVKKIDALTIQFEISDGEKNLRIIHKGLTPDLFRENQGVVASGIYDFQKSVFLSSELLVKHDENYMPPEVAKTNLSPKYKVGGKI